MYEKNEIIKFRHILIGRASDFPRSRKSRGIRGIADLKRNLEFFFF